MAHVALSSDYRALVFGLSIMAAEAVLERPSAKMGSFRVIRSPGFAVGGNMPPWNHDRIALDRWIMHHTGMAGHAPFSIPASLERRHMFPMAHDKADLFHRRRQISWRDFGYAKDVSMATQAASGIDVRFQVMRIDRRPKGIAHRIPCSGPHLVMQPTFESRPDMARDTGDFLVRRRRPALIRRRNHMAASAEFRVVGQRNGRAAERNHARHETEENRKPRCPVHAPIEHVGGIAS